MILGGLEFVIGAKIVQWGWKELNKSSPPPPAPSRPVKRPERPKPPAILPPERAISLVGRASGGKSSLGNALMREERFVTGIEHGTTTGITVVECVNDYVLQDTPGLLDGETYNQLVLTTAQASEIVIFVTSGQLYRQEVDFLKRLCTFQLGWNWNRGTQSARSTLIFLNGADLKERTMPSKVRETEFAALKEQVKEWIAEHEIFVGAAAPLDGAAPRIDELEAHLSGLLAPTNMQQAA